MKKITICIKKKDVCALENAIKSISGGMLDYIPRMYRKFNIETKTANEHLLVDLYFDEYSISDLFWLGCFFSDFQNLPY